MQFRSRACWHGGEECLRTHNFCVQIPSTHFEVRATGREDGHEEEELVPTAAHSGFTCMYEKMCILQTELLTGCNVGALHFRLAPYLVQLSVGGPVEKIAHARTSAL